MKILVVNTVYGTGSTGRIAKAVAEEYAKLGDEIRYAYGRADYVPDGLRGEAYRIGTSLGNRFHVFMTRFFDRHGTGVCSRWATKRFLRWAGEYAPDVLWLHNLHGYYINFELLFNWIKARPGMKVYWMLHDCWAFTGHCPHYTSTNCTQYQTECRSCPQRTDYPASFLFSNAMGNFRAKKRAFLGVSNLTLVIPSDWLAEQVRKGFLGDAYPVVIRRHTLDTRIFRPTPSDVRSRLGLKNGEKMVLCVASQWDRKKGVQDVLALSRMIPAGWRIVMVGVTARQLASLPKNVVGMTRMDSAQDLAELYSAADWFFNPTHEDIYSMTNMEAAACGCRVISYDTGGAPEAVRGYDRAVLLSEHTAAAAVRVMTATA